MSTIDSFRGEYRFLSNFWPCEILYEGMTYQSTEAAYQASKTLDMALREPFMHMDPKAAKAAGKGLVLRSDWNKTLKLTNMLEISFVKYRHEDLRDRLLATGDAKLVEGNQWHDNFWGSCTCERCGNTGQNYLGTRLMFVRNYIQSFIE